MSARNAWPRKDASSEPADRPRFLAEGKAHPAVRPAVPTFVPGKIGQAFQFNTYPDGSLIEYASLGYPDDLKFGTSTDFSIAFWIKTDGANIVGEDPAYIANRNWNSSGSRGWGIFMQKAYTTARVHYTVTDP
jgi:hypothetical protein